MYKLTHSGTIIRTADGASIPLDDRNSDYQEYLRWRDGYTDSNGVEHNPNTPEPADQIQPSPIEEVEMSQAREALLHFNMLDLVDERVKTMSRQAQIQWEYRTHVSKSNAFVQEIISSGFLTEELVDELFVFASKL